MNFQLADFLMVSPIIMLFIASVIPITVKVLRGNREQAPLATLFQAIGGLVAAGILLFIVSGSGSTAFSNALVFDGLTKWLGLISIGAAIMSVCLMYDNPSTSGKQFSELTFLTLSATIGMVVLVSAADLLMTFVGLETMSLALYLMIAISHEEKLSKEAALKYFILGGLASAIFLYGISFLFGTVGSTYIGDVIQATPDLIETNRLFLLGIVLAIVGFCFKVSIAPFHSWTPDVYQGAPTPHTAFMATAVKVVSFAAFLRIISTQSLIGSPSLLDVLQWLAVLTMVVGNIAAILQNNFKRMIAYSSVAHSGYILVGVITSGISETPSFGAGGVVFYLFSYSLMTIGCLALASLTEKNENSSLRIDDLAGLSKRHPVLALCLTVLLLSLAGIPPFVGFFGKFYLFSAAMAEGLIWLALWGMLGSVISVYYYLRPIVVMYMQDNGSAEVMTKRFATQGAILVSAILIVVLGVFSGPLFEVFEKALS